MLVLDRKVNDTIEAVTPSGERIVFRILSAAGWRVKIGVEAPADVRLLRGGLAEREREEAA